MQTRLRFCSVYSVTLFPGPSYLFSIHAFASRFPTELNVGEVSAQVFWNLFSADLQDMLKGMYNSSFCYFL